MQTIVVTRKVNRNLEEVFSILTHHAGYAQFLVVQAASLVRGGDTHPNGVGAIRHIQVNHVLFIENIVAYDPPVRMGYRVQACYLQLPFRLARIKIPFEHFFGEIGLQATGAQTAIHWESRFAIPAFMGKKFEPWLAKMGADAFETILTQAFAK